MPLVLLISFQPGLAAIRFYDSCHGLVSDITSDAHIRNNAAGGKLPDLGRSGSIAKLADLCERIIEIIILFITLKQEKP